MLWLDTGVLAALYVPEARSERVARLTRRTGEPIPFSQLHELELTNALQLRVFRREATRGQVVASLARVRDDLEAGVLYRVAVDWPLALARAVELADRHTPRLGCRSLDLLHVSAAAVSASDRFVTADRRQSGMARRAGLVTTRIP
ncbi:MAG: type II toxin-antitoxin system VapC family toxin [Deltaproteobacteria bacterium]|nr:type II toxin-antitoxin system VapC family toxin [Deltaproteobacteria bacterium]